MGSTFDHGIGTWIVLAPSSFAYRNCFAAASFVFAMTQASGWTARTTNGFPSTSSHFRPRVSRSRVETLPGRTGEGAGRGGAATGGAGRGRGEAPPPPASNRSSAPPAGAASTCANCR